ncbi:family 10 glycosylhydrolase [Paenibacillus sp. HJL G12]|uniref:Family 10 glycosylhydrolase n=1 Tax=Paenibacillus dendrobii TaxID=2691084 RepID=A0A7X3IJB4_9BACL|nr:family 10 glycosylhydrolase [Paenibacillus dendrobii]MWV44486.1 family 10 glycosylhydrolase [Paenibacillus dendrobii]
MINRVSWLGRPLRVVLILSLIVSAFISCVPSSVYGAATEEEASVEHIGTPQQDGGGATEPETDATGEPSGTDSAQNESEDTEQSGTPASSPEETVPVNEGSGNTAGSTEAVRLEISAEPVTVSVNTTKTFTLKGYAADGREVDIPQGEVAWSLNTDDASGIGTLTGSTFRAGDQPAEVIIAAAYGGLTAEATVHIIAPERQITAANSEWTQVFEDFEDISDLRVTSVKANSAALVPSERPGPVRYGLKAGRLNYDFANNDGTSAAYIRFMAPDGKDGREIPGSPKKIGFWAFGEDQKHWIRGQIQDSKGALYTLDFTGSSEVLNGWRYVTANMPAVQYPVKFNYIYLVETGTKTAGSLYVDQVSMLYEDTDVFALEWSGAKPLGTGESMHPSMLVTRKGDASPQPAEQGSIAFSSGDESVATVDADGTVTAHAAGEALLTATYQNKYSSVYRLTVTPTQAVPERILIEGPTSLVLTETADLKAYAVYGNGEPVEISAETAFSVPDGNGIAEITGRQIRALQVGETAVTAEYEGLEAGYTVQVKAGELKSIEIAEVFSAIVGEDTPAAKVIGDYKVEGKKEITTGITYGSTNSQIAVIDPVTGAITAVAPGTTMITAEVSGKKAQQLLVVTNPAAHPKRELRGAWISTVENIDWPTKGVLDPQQQRQDFVKLLDELKQTGINAVFVQVRPTSDSFFPSEYFPWSHWLTGEQGKAPSDGYDPLKFMVDEAHKRNLEFHAWINPYRISMHDNPDLLAPTHPARLHPDWVVKNGGKMYFNPAIPEAQNYIIDGVKEIVQNYDVDGIHMDDYFYPYPGNEPFDDSKEYNAYKSGGGTMPLDDWRRDNVNTIVKGLNAGIKQIKPFVKFGISPFGIWRNKGTDPTGSETNGQQNYDGLYADTRTWMKQGWVDYLAPQIYWHFGYSAAAYEKLIDWWTKEINGENDHSGKHNVQLYIGMAPYRVGQDNWTNPDQLPAQLRFNNDHGEDVSGNIMFSTSDLLGNPLGVRDAVASMYSSPALIPVMPWLPDDTPNVPKLTEVKGAGGSIHLSWEDTGDKEPAYYAIYRVQGDRGIDKDDASQLVATIRSVNGAAQTYTDLTAIPEQPYTYAVSAVGRLHHESGLSNEMTGQTDSSRYTAIELSGLQQMTVSQSQQIKVYGVLHSGAKEEITAGVSFSSSEPKTASISIAGVITAFAEGAARIQADYQGHSASFTLNVLATPATNPGTQPSGGAGSVSPSPSTPPGAVPNQRIVNDRDLDGVKDGKLEIRLSPTQTQVVVPGSVVARLGKDILLNIQADHAALSVPSSVLEEAMKLISGGNPNDLKLVIDMKPVEAKEATNILQRIQQHENAILTSNGMIQIAVSAQSNDGKSSGLQRFPNGMMLTLDIPDGAKSSRTGIYRILAAGGSLEYVNGAKPGEKQITVRVTVPGQYSAISYDKTFKDIASDHWASEVIKDMAARHVLKGLPDGTFAPGKEVTRAEFVSMLARLLNLPAKTGTAFTDVKEEAWYAEDVSAALQAGIIQGKGDGRFHPDQAVTREEMTMMLISAYHAAGGKNIQGASKTFRDQAGISPWAQDAVNEAAAIGLMQGSGGKFNPGLATTRAESAQALANLLMLTEYRL